MKPSLTKTEVAACLKALTLVSLVDFSPAEVKALTSIKSKLAPSDTPKGANAGALEVALMSKSNGKVVKLASGTGYALASKTAERLDITPEHMTLTGSWIGIQGWLQKGSLTMLDVMRKWHEWYPKAKALSENLGPVPSRERRPSL